MSKHWRWFIPGYLLALPATLVGFVLCAFYRAHSFRWHQGVLTCLAQRQRVLGQPGAQTLGWLVVYTDPRYRTERWAQDLRVHEYTHVVQGFVGGPLFSLAYGLCFLWYFAAQGFRNWHAAYMKNPFERHAYSVGHGTHGHEWGA